MICSEDEDLDRRREEHGSHLTVSGWKYKTAKERLPELKTAQVKKRKENCMGEHLDPRVPPKTTIIKKNLHLLHTSVVN